VSRVWHFKGTLTRSGRLATRDDPFRTKQQKKNESISLLDLKVRAVQIENLLLRPPEKRINDRQ
jgi:hypothetical protein